ncbi:hypothetical protein [Flavobacterium sp. N3904]|uniref:hypothetical protein n=1 Tax=Flavobacterium sp. N3904 TaxID=2986835 RepID=UPI0022254F82|nr:hypothetical protein [Flavobacterium sp. N3904]
MKTKLNLGKILVLVLVLILLALICRDFWLKNQVSESGKIIVVKFIKKEELPKTTNFYFSYYLNDSLIVTSNSGINCSVFNSENETKIIASLKLNAYYFAKHISKYPKIIIVNPKVRITNVDLIKKSGFSIEE